MCGRFETKPSVQTLIKKLKECNVELQLEFEDEKNKSVNIAPTEKIFLISYSNDIYKLSLTNWGIKLNSDSPLIFNSRIETILEKRFWQNLFDKNRALVPMSAFYEWKKEGTKKIPYRIYLPDEEIFFVPALNYTDKNNNIFTSLITTTPNNFIKPIHHRMPVIFNIKEGIKYLTDDKELNLSRCKPYDGKMDMERAYI